MREEKSISEILEEVRAEICDDYCRFRKDWEGTLEDLLRDKCMDCPLGRL